VECGQQKLPAATLNDDGALQAQLALSLTT